MMRPGLYAKEEISSTAKLLDVIRSESPSAPGFSEVPAFPSASTGQLVKEFLQHLPFLRKRMDVGIEIGSSHLTLVKMIQLSPSRHKLLDYRLVPIATNTPHGSPGFYEFLRSVVIDFSGPLHRVNLWSCLATAHGDLRQIRIPRKAAQSELCHAVFWVARKELNFDDRETLFDFEIQGAVTEEADGKIWVMAYTVPRDAVKDMKELFTKSGLALAGLTVTPFAVQNLFRSQWVPTSGKSTYGALQLGEDFSRICILFRENLILTKVIDIGTASLSASPDVVPGTDESLLEGVRPALENLTRRIEEVFAYHSGPGRGKPIQTLFVSGLVPHKAILNHLGENLGVRMVTVDLLSPANPFLSPVRPPLTMAERALFAPALGLALSASSRTPNLLCPFPEKSARATITRLNRALLWFFVMVFLVLGGLFLWQDHIRRQKTAELSQLQQELAHVAPVLDHDLVLQRASQVKAQQHLLKGKAEKYLSLAVLSELAALTPDHIRLLNITADFGGLPETAGRDVGPGRIKSVSQGLVIDGMVQGDSLTAETSLAHYLMRLGASPLFVDPSVHLSALENYQETGEVLHFILKMGLVQGV